MHATAIAPGTAGLCLGRVARTFGIGAALFLLAAGEALAAGAGGGSMPYSSWLTTFRTSLSGEIPMVIATIAIVCGVGGWIVGGEMAGMMMYIMRAACGCAIILGVVTFISTLGVGGAVVPLAAAALAL